MRKKLENKNAIYLLKIEKLYNYEKGIGRLNIDSLNVWYYLIYCLFADYRIECILHVQDLKKSYSIDIRSNVQYSIEIVYLREQVLLMYDRKMFLVSFNISSV